MHSLIKNSLIIAVLSVLILTGCGRKEMPQPVTSEEPPSIVSISHEVAGNSLKIELQLAGGSYGIGYQIDRAEIDPYCKCPGFWRRYLEEAPNPANFDKPRLSQLISIKSLDTEYAFRVRAIDALGRFSEWSQIIRVKIDPSFIQ